MSRSITFIALPFLLTLAFASDSTAQNNVDLHTIRVAPRGDVIVVYSKDFPTCAHILTPSNQLTHTQNLWCTQANNVATVHPPSAFNANFVPNNQVKLCHGNNYGVCSPLRTITSGTTLSANNWNISLQAGGAQAFTLDAGSGFSGRLYFLLGTASGTVGFNVGPHLIPLTLDSYFSITLTSPNTFPLAGSVGVLDGAGRATSSFTLPPVVWSALRGLVLHHAFVVLDQTGVLDVSNPWPLTLVQ